MKVERNWFIPIFTIDSILFHVVFETANHHIIHHLLICISDSRLFHVAVSVTAIIQDCYMYT